jgi:excisionase family DNA binding protein
MAVGAKKLLTYRELAEVLDLSLRTVVKMTLEGKIPYLKIGACVRFDLPVVKAALQRRIEPK